MCCDSVHALPLTEVPHLHCVVVTPRGNMETGNERLREGEGEGGRKEGRKGREGGGGRG